MSSGADVTAITKQGRTAQIMPFDMSGVERSDDGVLRYTGLPQSLLHMFRESVERHPDRECIVVLGGERVTYQQVWDRVGPRGRWAAARPACSAGDRVANRHGNSLEWCLGFWGTLMAGGVVVPVNTRFSEIRDRVRGVRFAGRRSFSHPERRCPTASRSWSTTSSPTRSPRSSTRAVRRVPQGGHDVARELPVEQRDVQADHATTRRHPPAQPRLRAALPRHRLQQPAHHHHPAERHDGRSCPPSMYRRSSPAVVDEQINILTSVPAIFWLAMSQPNFPDVDVSNVRWVTYGGAPTAPDVVAKLRSSFPNARLGNGFGLTETSSVSTFLPDEYAEFRPETVGFTAPPVEVDLVDVDPASGVGELLIRGQNVVVGVLEQTGADGRDVRRRLVAHRRPRAHRRRRLRADRRPHEGHGQPRRRERLLRRGRECARPAPRPYSRSR